MFRGFDVSNTAFKRRPFNFITPTFYWVLLKAVYLFSLFGVVYLLFMATVVANVTLDKTSWVAIFILTLLVFIFWDSGLNGSLVDAYRNGVRKRRTIFMEFFTSGKKYRNRLFAIKVLRVAATIVLSAPILLAYTYIPSLQSIQYMPLIIGIWVLASYGLVGFLTYPSIILIVTKNFDVRTAVNRGLRFLRRNPTEAIMSYAIYGRTVIVNCIPLIDVVSIFLIFPVVYGGLIASIDKTR